MADILNGREVSLKIKETLKKQIKTFQTPPKLAVILVGENPSSLIYIKSKEKTCLDLGIDFELIKFAENVDSETIEHKIRELNNDKRVHSILVQCPLPNHLDSQKIIDIIDPLKDVDGLTSSNISNLVNNYGVNVPCTPAGIIKLLDFYNVELEGKHIVIVGRSNLVGKPLFHLLLNRNATVTMCHSKTKDFKKFTKEADILIVAVGKKDLINKEMIKENAILIDVGINRKDGSKKIYGDINFDDVFEKCSLITPVPGGIGPMTVMMMMNNVVKSYLTQNDDVN